MSGKREYKEFVGRGNYEESWRSPRTYSVPVAPRRTDLTPHAANPQLRVYGKPASPTILVAASALQRMQAIIHAVDHSEVGWLGSVHEFGEDTYLIDRIFLFEQTVGPGHCDISQDSVAKFWTELLKSGPEGEKLLDRIKFWGHLHPGMSTAPSHQDEETMKMFEHNAWFIRAICSRWGRATFDFFDYKGGYEIRDVPWYIKFSNSEVNAEVKKEVEEKVEVEKIEVVRPRASLLSRDSQTGTYMVLPNGLVVGNGGEFVD